MILQALNDYYRRKCDDPEPAQRLPAFGLEQKGIPFLLEITAEGKLVQLIDTRTLNGKKKVAQIFRVPLGEKKASGVVANLLWDTLEYVLGVDTRGKPERVAEQHAQFVARIKALPQTAQEDAGIQAVLAFLSGLDLAQLQAEPAWAQAFEVNAVMSFRLHDDVNLVCQRPAVVNAALNVVTDGDERLSMCLVTGNDAPVQRLHAAIKGVWGAQSSGANIVSFNARAFESYGKTERQGENAPVSHAVAFAYTTALNHLLGKGSSQRIQVGDASTVFWADKDSAFESAIPNIFGEPPTDNPNRNAQAVQALFAAMHSGKLAGPDGQTRFHMLGLAPNAARISIRFYHCLPLHELGERILQYFKDLELVRGPNDPQYPSLKRLLQAVCLSTSSQPYGDIDRVPPNLGGAIVDAVFAGPDVPYPSLWLNAAVGRCRAEQNVNYLRAAAIKACLNRQLRRSSVSLPNQPTEKEFLPMLDHENIKPAYRMGRLFAVLERIQEESAGGPGKLNSTIRDRFYGAASSSPATVFPMLFKLKNHHISKLDEKARRILYRAFEDNRPDDYIGQIMQHVVEIPAHLALKDQGGFALGYYHQRQAFFTKNPDAPSATLSSPSTPEGN
jgi:CRISPR-associated protein Csd1